MINVSDEFRQLMQERTDFKCNAQITFADGNVLELTEDDFVLSGNCIVDGAGTDGLPLGVAVGRTIQLAIMNDDDHLAVYDFFGAKIRLYLTFALSDTIEKIEEGTFTVLDPETYGDTVTVTACDDMYKTDTAYTTELQAPVSIGIVYREACESCGIPYLTTEFKNSGVSVWALPSGEYTFREVFGFIAMMAGGNARINRQGYMEIISYDLLAENTVLTMENWNSLTVATDDILITGLQTKVSETDEDGNASESTVLRGEEGYVLELENPMFQLKEGRALAIISDGIVGASFRKFEGEHVGCPLVEFMDTVTVVDRKGNQYRSVVTDVEFTFCGFTSLSNSATDAVRNSCQYISPETKANIAARKLVEEEKTARETSVAQLKKVLDESSGLYFTEEAQDDGSSICYLHDKPTKESSQNVIKLTADAIGFSSDGGESYPFGFTVNGQMVMGIIQAEGIEADWVKLDDKSVTEYITDAVERDEYGKYQESMESRLEFISGRIDAVVTKETNQGDQLSELSTQITQTAESLEARVERVESDGVGKVVTGTGVTLDKEGLRIYKDGEEIENRIDNKGMYVHRGNEVMLRADADGVIATDVSVRNYLNLGEYARFEDYNNGEDGRRTACYWTGG